MKLSWFFVLLLLIFVAIFSVQNADVITVRLLAWEFTLSAALLIQLAALLGAFVGIGIGLRSRKPVAAKTEKSLPALETSTATRASSPAAMPPHDQRSARGGPQAGV